MASRGARPGSAAANATIASEVPSNVWDMFTKMEDCIEKAKSARSIAKLDEALDGITSLKNSLHREYRKLGATLVKRCERIKEEKDGRAEEKVAHAQALAAKDQIIAQSLRDVSIDKRDTELARLRGVRDDVTDKNKALVGEVESLKAQLRALTNNTVVKKGDVPPKASPAPKPSCRTPAKPADNDDSGIAMTPGPSSRRLGSLLAEASGKPPATPPPVTGRKRARQDTPPVATQQKRQRVAPPQETMHPARKAALEAERKEAARKKMLETRFPECRGKFAYKLQSKPTGLDHIGYNSYMNAVLQALAATLDPAKLYAERGKDAQFSTGYDNKTSDAVRKDKATRRLIDLIADMQRGQFKHLDADKLQSAFSHIHGNDKFRGVDEVDPKEFLESLMETIKCRYVDDTYRIQQRFESKCRKWSGKCKAGDVAARTYSDTYVLELDKPDPVGQRCKYPQYPQEVLKLKLEDLLRKKAALIQQVDCPCCKLDTARQNWAGFEEAPKVLTVSFKRVNDEPGKAKYKYQPELPESIDLCELGLLDANQKKGRYTLTSVVKHEGDSLEAGKYFNYTRTENGQWWRCYNASVGPVYFPAVNTNRDGQTHLAFYTLDN